MFNLWTAIVGSKAVVLKEKLFMQTQTPQKDAIMTTHIKLDSNLPYTFGVIQAGKRRSW